MGPSEVIVDVVHYKGRRVEQLIEFGQAQGALEVAAGAQVCEQMAHCEVVVRPMASAAAAVRRPTLPGLIHESPAQLRPRPQTLQGRALKPGLLVEQAAAASVDLIAPPDEFRTDGAAGTEAEAVVHVLDSRQVAPYDEVQITAPRRRTADSGSNFID